MYRNKTDVTIWLSATVKFNEVNVLMEKLNIVMLVFIQYGAAVMIMLEEINGSDAILKRSVLLCVQVK